MVMAHPRSISRRWLLRHVDGRDQAQVIEPVSRTVRTSIAELWKVRMWSIPTGGTDASAGWSSQTRAACTRSPNSASAPGSTTLRPPTYPIEETAWAKTGRCYPSSTAAVMFA